jgi:two-component sensor histidine kinase
LLIGTAETADCISPGWDEAERLAALHDYAILDTDPEQAFDDIVALASGICEAPIALVSLVDASRQWFKSEVGLGVKQTALDVSICGHAILQSGLFVVPDTTTDPRFSQNPLVTGAPYLRFYGGAVLKTAGDLPIGTLCVLDYKPRPAGLSERQGKALEALARQVMTQLELRRALMRRRQTEEALNAALAEKDLLIQEVDHRVKNSLQMVQNLLTLQARKADPIAATALRDASTRVNTIAAVHDRLGRGGPAQTIDLASYLQALIGDLREATGAVVAGRLVQVRAEAVDLTAAVAPVLGLVTTELVMNAMKYGAGTIQVTARRDGQSVCLVVEDEGVALPADFDPLKSRGLGMRVVGGLLKSRNGRLVVERTRGHTCFEAWLPLPG